MYFYRSLRNDLVIVLSKDDFSQMKIRVPAGRLFPFMVTLPPGLKLLDVVWCHIPHRI